MAKSNDLSFSSEWETFCTEVVRVVASANNQRGLANEEFSEYVVEQLEMIIITVSTLKIYLGSHLPSSELESEIAISNICVKSWAAFWNASDVYCRMEEYLNHPFSSGNYSYSFPTSASSGPGRPRFDMARKSCQNYCNTIYTCGLNLVTVYLQIGYIPYVGGIYPTRRYIPNAKVYTQCEGICPMRSYMYPISPNLAYMYI